MQRNKSYSFNNITMQDKGFPSRGALASQTEDNKHNEQMNKSPVIFCWDKNIDIQWLQYFLSRASIPRGSVCCILHTPGEDWKTLAERSSPIILCHSFTTNTEWTCLEEFLTHCRGFLGKRVIVIVTDVKDRDSEESVSEKWKEWKFSDCDLITLTCQEMDFISTSISQDFSPERRMARKLNSLKNILQTTAVEKDTIGIFSRSEKSECSWLVKLLTSMHFRGCVRRATPYYIANNKSEQFRRDVSQCTFGVLYHTKNSGRINLTNVTSSLYDKELEYLHEQLGRDNVIVVIDNLEERTDQMKDQILKEQHSIEKWARDLFIFGQEEKITEKMNRLEIMITGSTGQHAPAFPDPSRQHVPAPASLTWKRFFLPNVSKESITPRCNSFGPSQTQSTKSGFNSRKEQSTEKNSFTPLAIKQVQTVGIFSITSDTEYSWLKSLLGNKFGNVRSFYISFSQFHQFMDDLSQCSHGILYHTKNRGRINVTDVTDSLFDKHLKHMSDTLGKNRVIVVLDDLDDNSDKIKRTILQEQPKIRQLAQELFIVKKGTDQQKVSYFKHNRKPDFSLM